MTCSSRTHLPKISYRRTCAETRVTATMTSSTVTDLSTLLMIDSAFARDRDDAFFVITSLVAVSGQSPASPTT